MTGRLLEVLDLAVTFRVQDAVTSAVEGASFHIQEGETVALVGESGSGKSVTALSILQLLPYPAAAHPSGSISFRGEELMGASPATLRAIRGDRISMIFQEPMTSLNPLHTIGKQVSEVLRLHKRLGLAALEARTLELLEMVSLRDAHARLGAYPHQLSGGERQRVMIAMALANKPDLLIADEPTTALDVTIQAQILALLKDLQARLGMALLLITHDLSVVAKMAERTYVMTEGKIVESGPTRDILKLPKHPYTRHLLGAEPKGRPASTDPRAPQVMTSSDIKVHFPVKRGALRRTIDHIKAVDGISLNIRQGHTLGIVGESGSGKTTLGLALLRLISSKGSIKLQGEELQGLKSRALRSHRRRMQMVFQDPFGSLNPRLSIGQIIEEGMLVHGIGTSRAERRALIGDILQEVGLERGAQDRYPHEFSGGQRQRVAIARALILKPDFLVLDEPTSALDRSVQAQIIDLLHDLQVRHGLAYLFISHDLKVVRALADEIVVMQGGKVIEQGLTEDIFTTPKKPYTKSLISAAFELEVAAGITNKS